MTSLLSLDVDKTILEKQKFDNIAYEKVSNDVFGRTISMMCHPITKEKDKNFAKYSNHKIWEYKIRQILESGETLIDQRNEKKVENIEEIDIDYLVSQLGGAAVKELEECDDISRYVNILLHPTELAKFAVYSQAIGIATSGARIIQDAVLDKLGFYSKGMIDKELCTFAEEGKYKEELIHETTGKYFDKFKAIPDNIIYIGDSENDMKAIKNLNKVYGNKFNYKGIGVLTGFSNETELYNNGADLVVPNLKDKKNLKKVKDYLRGLENV